MRFRRTCALGISAVTVATLVLASPVSAAVEPEESGRSTTQTRSVIPNPDQVLGKGWRDSSDVLVTGSGDTDGFHLYVAREKDAYSWTTLATLNAGRSGVGAWTGYVCVTGSGRYAAVVYAPAIASNKPALLTAGAYAAIIDTTTGIAKRIEGWFQLAYFNPSCGPGENVLLTRAIGIDQQQQTDLIKVDAATARTTGTRRIKGHLTNPVPAPDGDYGIVRGELVRVDKAGKLTKVARPGGQPYAARATAGGAIDLLTVQRTGGTVRNPDERAVAYRYVRGVQHRVGDAPRTGLELFGLSDGRNALVGDLANIAKSRFADLSTISMTKRTQALSRHGNLAALRISTQPNPAQAGGRVAKAPPQAAELAVTVQSTRTGLTSSGVVVPKRQAAADAGAPARPAPGGRSAAVDDEFLFPKDANWPKCAVPRNDVRLQVPQPSANQIEWAVDLAVQGKLRIQRPQNYLNIGNPAYTPQGLFPLPSGPRVPAQIMLAILAQETNMYQASWHAVPGDAGNPLVSDYYGLRAGGGALETIDFPTADCGYGVSQVTDGMEIGSNKWTKAQREAIATDYAANIAAGLQILVQKYKEVRATGTWINNDDPANLENWFLAVWGYNSGVYSNNGTGAYGVGYLNNPANPNYPANREPFLRASLDDASHPADWSYPEKIMGWAETPQWQWIFPFTKYSKPQFGTGSGGKLGLPSRYQFCEAVNHCDPSKKDPCPSWNSNCWWHGHTSWLESDSRQEFSTESLAHAVGSPEPPVFGVYGRACTPLPLPNPFSVIVDDLTDSGRNVLGCAGQPWGGKFTLRGGFPPGSPYADYAQVDMHQMGTGYLGHSWFTHSYDPDTPSWIGKSRNYHEVIGTWTPAIVADADYQIVVHLPSHGAQERVEYIIKSPGSEERVCTVNQNITARPNGEVGKDMWINLGTYRLKPGARVQLSNMVENANGSVDVAYDAMAFIADSNKTECNSVR